MPVYVRDHGAVGDGVVIDTTAFANAIAAAADGDVVMVPNGTFLIDAPLTITKSLHFVGPGTLKCATNGLDSWIDITNCNNVSFDGLSFDDALKGRTIIDVDTVDNLRIDGCSFTGYSADFGHGGSDSAIRFTTVTNATVTNCRFLHFGDQYGDSGTDPNHLNRCLSVNANCNDIVFSHNVLSEVNQGIIVSGTGGISRMVVSANTFRNVRDNSLYILAGVDGLDITGNVFERTAAGDADESIVLVDCAHVTITGNIFREIPNKCITYSGAVSYVTIVGNQFHKDNPIETGGNAITYRNGSSDSITNCLIADNIFSGQYWGADRVVGFDGTSSRVRIQGNIFTTLLDTSGDTQIQWRGTINDCAITDNNFDNLNAGAGLINFYGWRIDNASAVNGLVVARNRYNNTVGRWATYGVSLRDEGLDGANARAGAIGQDNRIGWGSAAPTVGTWLKGDIVYSTAPSSGGFIGWVCTTAGSPGTWKTFGAIS